MMVLLIVLVLLMNQHYVKGIYQDYKYPTIFYCKNDDYDTCIAGDYLCDGYKTCDNNEDEQACKRS